MFSIHVTKLTMNFSRFHVLRIQETDYRPHFTCGGNLYFLKHYKHTARCVNTVQMSANFVRALTKNPKTRHACAPSWPQRCSDNIRKRNLFSGYPSYVWHLHTSIVNGADMNVFVNFTFMLPCVVIDFLLNNQPDQLIIPILFCYKILHVSGIFSAHHQESSTLTLHGSGHQKPAWNLPVPNVQ